MATLTIPHSFTAGTPALASEVNANFQAIVTWTQSNIGTDNLGVLGARSSALPSGPSNAILSVQQTSSNPAIYLSNSGSDFSLQIQQGGLLATNKSIVSITDSFNQTAAGAAHMRMTLSNSTNIPALEIVHGVQNTFKVQRTGISTDVNITTAGNIGVAIVNATTVNTTNLSPVAITAPTSDALAIKVKGRSSDNTAVVQFKSNDDATVYASVNSSTSGLGLNLPDTADKYDFQVNGITKGVIDNNGIDGQYLKTASVTNNKIVSLPYFQSGTISASATSNFNIVDATLYTNTLTATKDNAKIDIQVQVVSDTAFLTTNGTGQDIDPGHLYVQVSGPGGYTGYASWGLNVGGTFQGVNKVLILSTAGTYTFTFKIGRAKSSFAPNYGYAIAGCVFFVYELAG